MSIHFLLGKFVAFAQLVPERIHNAQGPKIDPILAIVILGANHWVEFRFRWVPRSENILCTRLKLGRHIRGQEKHTMNCDKEVTDIALYNVLFHLSVASLNSIPKQALKISFNNLKSFQCLAYISFTRLIMWHSKIKTEFNNLYISKPLEVNQDIL